MTTGSDVLAVYDTAELLDELARRGVQRLRDQPTGAMLAELSRRGLEPPVELPRDDAVILGDLEVDPIGCVATWRGRAVVLSPRETQVLYALAKRGGHCRSDRLAQMVWRGFALVAAGQNLRVTMRSLRRKMPGAVPVLRGRSSVYGVYRLDVGLTKGEGIPCDGEGAVA